MNIKKLTLLTALAATTLLTQPVFASTTQEKLTEYFSDCEATKLCNGSYLVKSQGQTVFEKSFGIENFLKESTVTAESQFNIASISKPFTAMAIVILEEKGLLRYNQEISSILTELPNKGITIDHLLHHTSGLPDHFRLLRKMKQEGKLPEQFDNEYLVALFAKKGLPLEFEPGEQWKYSNSGYALLAEIVTRVAKQPFHEFLAEHIFSPLEMHDTHSFSINRKVPLEHRTLGFRLDYDGGHSLRDVVFTDGIEGDGGIYSTAKDLTNWYQAIKDEALISAASWKKVFSGAVLNNGKTFPYGKGWDLRPNKYSEDKVSHNGGWRGFSTDFYYQPNRDILIVALSNNSMAAVNQKHVNNVLDILNGKEVSKFKPSVSHELYKVVTSKNEKATRAFWQNAKTSKQYDIAEREINRLGYLLMEKGLNKEATLVLTLNKETYPSSPNVYDSLAEAHVKSDNKDAAQRVLLEGLEQIPMNQPIIDKLAALGYEYKVKVSQFSLDPKTLKSYEGKFQVTENLELIFTVKNDKLYVSPNGTRTMELQATKANWFQTLDSSRRFRFELDGKQVTGVEVFSRGRSKLAPKVN